MYRFEPRAFCGHAILDDQPLVIPDAVQDPRTSDNPLVLGEPRIRFYAGAPLITSDGYRLGALCVIDQRARAVPLPWQKDILRDLARLVMKDLELRIAGHRLQSEVEGHRDAKEMLERSYRAIKAAYDSKMEFLAQLSHEIRNPLTAVGWSWKVRKAMAPQ